MSSLAERLAQTQAEAAKKIADEEAIRIRSKQVAQQATLRVQEEKQKAARQEQERMAALIANLSPLLDTVGARDLLEEVKEIWKVGTIDPAPQLISESPAPSVGIALRYRFVNVEPNLHQTMVGDGEDPWTHDSSGLHLKEVALFVITGQEESRSTVQAAYGSRSLRCANFGRWGMGGEYSTALDTKFQYLAQAGPEQFQITDPENARSLLENQLYDVLLRTGQPLQQENARIAIAKDQFTSLPPAQNYYRSLMKSIRGLQPENSAPWYKRLLT